MQSLEITEEDIRYYKSIHPDKSSITPIYRTELLQGLITRIKENYYTSPLPAKEFYDNLSSDFKKSVTLTDVQVSKALKCIAVQISITGRVKNNFIKVSDKDVVGLSIYTESGRKGDLYYALAETVDFCINKHKIVPGIVQWVTNEGYSLDEKFHSFVVPRSHVLETDSTIKVQRKKDIEALLNGLKTKSDLSKIKFNYLVIQKR